MQDYFEEHLRLYPHVFDIALKYVLETPAHNDDDDDDGCSGSCYPGNHTLL